MLNSLLLSGMINRNKYNANSVLSNSVNIEMVEKSPNEMLSKRHSLLRFNQAILDNKLIIKDISIKTIVGYIDVSICCISTYSLNSVFYDEASVLKSVKEQLVKIYERKNININSTGFSYRNKTDSDFWWDLNNDIMWSFDSIFINEFLSKNIENSVGVLLDNSIIDLSLIDNAFPSNNFVTNN